MNESGNFGDSPMAQEKDMISSVVERPSIASSAVFFAEAVKPKLPPVKGLSNHGENTVLREEVTPQVEALIVSNVQFSILLSL